MFMRTSIVKSVAIALVLGLSGCGGDKTEVNTVTINEPERGVSDVICSYAPSQSSVVSHVSALVGGGAVAGTAIANATGLSVVAHSSGAYILSGSGGYIAGTLGGAIVAPVLVGVGLFIGGSAVTVELVCAPKNHPEFSVKIEAAAEEFVGRTKNLAIEGVSSSKQIIKGINVSLIKTGSDAIEYARRKSIEFEDAVVK